MRKINKTAKIATVLLLVACLSITCAASAFAANYANIDNVRVAQIENVGSDGSKLKTNILDNGENELVASNVSYVLLNNGDLELVGEVNNVPFDVNAVPYSTPANENVQVYEGLDQSNNYQVLYVALETEISESVKYFDDVNSEAYRYMVKLYMRTNGSDDIIIIEIFTNGNCFSNQMDQVQVSANLTDTIEDDPGKINQFWYAKVFEPIEEYSEGISPRVMYEDINEGTYTYIFDVFGATYYQYFTLHRYVSWPSSFSNQESFRTMLVVNDAYTEVPGYPNENSDTTYMRITSAKIDVAVDEGDAVSKFTFDGLTHLNASASVTLKFNTSISLWGPLSIALSYTNSDNSFDLNSEEEQLENYDNHWHRQVGAELQSGHRLDSAGHFFSVDWLIANYSGAKTNQAFNVKFTYYMMNMLDYTHWTNGEKYFTDTVYYNTTA